jgi:hypothetical protein
MKLWLKNPKVNKKIIKLTKIIAFEPKLKAFPTLGCYNKPTHYKNDWIYRI